jgi:phosphate-selective porin OprO/OprP
VAARFSWLNLNDNGIQGGQLTDWTAGVNWYWNPNTKLVFNYVHARASVPGSDQSQTDMFGLRAQVDF